MLDGWTHGYGEYRAQAVRFFLLISSSILFIMSRTGSCFYPKFITEIYQYRSQENHAPRSQKIKVIRLSVLFRPLNPSPPKQPFHTTHTNSSLTHSFPFPTPPLPPAHPPIPSPSLPFALSSYTFSSRSHLAPQSPAASTLPPLHSCLACLLQHHFRSHPHSKTLTT